MVTASGCPDCALGTGPCPYIPYTSRRDAINVSDCTAEDKQFAQGHKASRWLSWD